MDETYTSTALNQFQILEADRRFSQSLIWELERNYFQKQGINAWNSGTVPHYVTSNPTIAKAYAKLIFAFLRDAKNDTNNPLNSNQPLYILELGSGSGRFAYHFLKKFFSLLSNSVLKDISVKYLMTDFSQQNLDYWQQHSHLKPYLKQNLLDFALFDANQAKELKLHHSGEIINCETLKNPLVAIANYFFDCLPQDVFYINSGQIYESLVTLKLPKLDLSKAIQAENNGSRNIQNLISSFPDLLDRLEISYQDNAIASDYYEDSNLNAILKHYQQNLADTTLLFPYVGLELIRKLSSLSNQRFKIALNGRSEVIPNPKFISSLKKSRGSKRSRGLGGEKPCNFKRGYQTGFSIRG